MSPLLVGFGRLIERLLAKTLIAKALKGDKEVALLDTGDYIGFL